MNGLRGLFRFWPFLLARPGVLAEVLRDFRREFWHAFLFTACANFLMLTPTLYLLQIFDRVLVSYSEFTLYAVTLILLFLVGMMSFSEWARARLLTRLGARLELALSARVFALSFEWRGQGKEEETPLDNLARLRQFMTGAGLSALLDAPWSPLYVAVMFLLHPALGVLSIVFCFVLGALAWLSGRVMREPLESARLAAREEALWLQGKLAHTETASVMGMSGRLRAFWSRRHADALAAGRRGLDAQTRMQSITRFVRFFSNR
ncbi:MAG: hypothetical protein LBG69_05175 [Zoogloeaceae bacterium]|jgi:ATP-binding cassette subfamily C exporter for protease/lipase|nr:hypothetical protein [Zoogloeaceae bacterium]